MAEDQLLEAFDSRVKRRTERREFFKAAIGADHAEYARVMGSVPQPPQGQFTASGPQLADNGMGQSGAPSSGSAPFWAR